MTAFRPLRKKPTTIHDLLANPKIDLVYVAVAHYLREKLYCDLLAAGSDLFAEKPFGIELAAARRLLVAGNSSSRLLYSSELPFSPMASALDVASNGITPHRLPGGSLVRAISMGNETTVHIPTPQVRARPTLETVAPVHAQPVDQPRYSRLCFKL